MVLDTHVALWALGDTHRLSLRAIQAIGEAEQQRSRCMVSVLSFYEIARAIDRGRIRSNRPAEQLLSDMQRRFIVLPVTAEIAITAAQLPETFPPDPFDRIIAATALAEEVPLVTADERILNSGALPTLWQ